MQDKPINDKNKVEYLSKKNIYLIIAIMAFAGILISYVETTIVLEIPILVKFFNVSYDSVSWILIAYIISSTISAALSGKIADNYGKRKVFLALALFYALAVSMGGFARTLDELIIIRAIQGIGTGMFPLAFAVINDFVDKDKLPLAQGIMGATLTIGAGLGLVLGTLITQSYRWQWSYYSTIPAAFVLVILTYAFLKDKIYPGNLALKQKGKVDYIGASALGISLFSIIFYISEGGIVGYTKLYMLFTLAISFISLIYFVRYEMNFTNPFINIKLLKTRNVLLSNIVGLFVMALMYILFFTVPTFLQDPSPSGLGKTIFESGIIELPLALLNIIFAPIAATVIKRKSAEESILIGFGIALVSFILLIDYRYTVTGIIIGSAVFGSSMSFMLVGVINKLLNSVPKENAGEASGVNDVFRNIGMAIAPAIGGVIETIYFISVKVAPTVIRHFPSATAFNYIYYIGLVFSIIGIILTLFMKPNKEVD
ncbi:DHA2 family major facilitator superfamily permease [Candidatus Mancarchaeum acidiphilum]|uniref:DHA2 family major facilitator superfamily permease n=1 Tax=Candidatus Mancarchaeum acidiphilum TaxID=1920749 RepID=A0A218NML2_9ARCH|nr:MFS transporter [Candidatus Mancarchaeum acidiphilum]ASI13719.1 DHA2 family major facilitator superfamily permease [Candidatus Mancarchaeum acidiphilum]